MSFVFVSLSHDYADEFYVEGCFVQEKSDFEADLKKIEAGFKEHIGGEEIYFGTNEFLLFSTFEDFMCGVSVKECSEQFFDEFKVLTGGSQGFNVMEIMLGELPAPEDSDV